MLKNSTRRWLAGLGVAGAFLAASATPAQAADDIRIMAYDLQVAPNHTAYGFIAAYTSEDELKKLTLDLDLSQVDDFATIDVATTDWTCDQNASTLHCEAEAGEYGVPGFNYYLNAKADAKPGTKAELGIKAVGDGQTATRTITVTVAEGVDLQSVPEASFDAEPGATVGLVGTEVHNAGPETARGVVLRLQQDYLSPYAGNFSNCRFIEEVQSAICTIDTELKPGKTYRLSEKLPVKVDQTARTGSSLFNYVDWWTEDDWKVVTDDPDFPLPPGTPGTGEKLELVEVPAARQGAPQTDVDPWNSFTAVKLTVLGDNTADLAAVGGTATGKVGDEVKVSAGFENLGPATIETWRLEGPLLEVNIPKGTTAVGVSEECAPMIEDQPWDPWQNAGEPGARRYGCLTWGDVAKGDKGSYEFTLKIDELAGETSGLVETVLAGDKNVANNKASLTVKFGNATTPGNPGGGGGDGGSLPITGENSGLFAGVGGLLLVAGAAGYLVAKRRRTRFVA
ncbi:LPXTG cell wall anchor domain-containing protein [Micromonospora phytophila]|uniref:LPXTG cell wall anchor domain-containing protein n=1 Tax=Micromonospora phytophila TaxID=709888 RepID=UPI00202EB1F5|nr:LPXTG cell wall anchor domain-containing protein [Micromonospora phytophila]MCM0677262.1 LPXTG cell wall anchor domain-containing protein [Micromonospora phytophila]